MINQSQGNVANETSSRWKNILKQLIAEKSQSEVFMKKSVMIRSRILQNDIESSTNYSHNSP